MVKNLILEIKFMTFGIVAVVLSSCSTQTCSKEQLVKQNSDASKTMAVIADQQNMKTVKVYKFDGSKQCENGTGVSAQEMSKELQSIQIVSFANKHDGLMRIQMCGSPTGQCNVYEIPESDLPKAEQLGFKKWKND